MKRKRTISPAMHASWEQSKMPAYKKAQHFPQAQSGFSLIEVMVGLVVSLLVSLVIMQVFAVFEEQKRSTSGSADAQTNGHIALYNLQRDVQLAGFALPIFSSSNSPLQCTTLTPSGTNISPVSITDGGAASDTVKVTYGSSDASGSPALISSVVSGNEVNVLNNAACKMKDSVIISQGSDCLFMQNGVSGLTGTTSITLNKPTDATINQEASLSCLGDWKTISYSIHNANQLIRSDNGSDTPNVDEIVNLQAQYGISAKADSNTVTHWVNATGALWTNPSNANRNLIKAIRVAVVARNGLLEKNNVSAACSSLTSSKLSGVCAWAGSASDPAPTISLTNTSNWQRYRYRVFTTIIPLRNIVWSSTSLAT